MMWMRTYWCRDSCHVTRTRSLVAKHRHWGVNGPFDTDQVSKSFLYIVEQMEYPWLFYSKTIWARIISERRLEPPGENLFHSYERRWKCTTETCFIDYAIHHEWSTGVRWTIFRRRFVGVVPPSAQLNGINRYLMRSRPRGQMDGLQVGVCMGPPCWWITFVHQHLAVNNSEHELKLICDSVWFCECFATFAVSSKMFREENIFIQTQTSIVVGHGRHARLIHSSR